MYKKLASFVFGISQYRQLRKKKNVTLSIIMSIKFMVSFFKIFDLSKFYVFCSKSYKIK
jgi:hypothetical protein